MSDRALDQKRIEFTATGTAVRASGSTHLRTPFTTTLDGQDFAKLLSVGWMASSIVIGISVAIRHDDYQMRLHRGTWTANGEIDGLTELANAVREDARRQVADRAARAGADGTILSSPLKVTLQAVRAGVNHYDHVSEATMFADAVIRFADSAVSLVSTVSTISMSP